MVKSGSGRPTFRLRSMRATGEPNGFRQMRSVIKQSVLLPAPAESLYAMYLDPARHAEITGAPVTISPEPGSEFRAFEGRISGTMRVR